MYNFILRRKHQIHSNGETFDKIIGLDYSRTSRSLKTKKGD